MLDAFKHMCLVGGATYSLVRAFQQLLIFRALCLIGDRTLGLPPTDLYPLTKLCSLGVHRAKRAPNGHTVVHGWRWILQRERKPTNTTPLKR